MPEPQAISLMNPGAECRALEADLLSAFTRVIRSGEYILGKEVAEFEREFAQYCGVKHAVGVASGLAALQLALVAGGVGPGDEVITAANTYIGTVLAIRHAGATPVLADIDAETANLDPEQFERAITPRTRAVIPVHLYGQPADMQPIREVAARHGIWVLEDAAQAQGAADRGQRTGALGRAGCFSFYPTKNLGGIGDAGCVTTDDTRLAERVRSMRHSGRISQHEYAEIGYTERLDELQAAILRVKLPRLDAANDARRLRAAWYDQLLADLPLRRPFAAADSRHVYHVYVIQVEERDRLAEYLRQQRIGVGIHYPTPLHREPVFAEYPFARKQFSVAERRADKILSLPMYPQLPEADVQRVAQAIRDFFAR